MGALRKGICRSPLRQEKGQYLVYTGIALPLVILLLALVVDGGFLFVGYRKTVHTASLAAQAASHAIDADHFLATNEVRLDALRAREMAASYAALNSGGQVRITQLRVRGEGVLVEAEMRVPMIFMRIFGLREVTVRAWSVATPRFGIETIGQ